MTTAQRYLPHTSSDIAEMLQTVGVESTAELFDTIPKDLQLGRPLALPEAMSEPDLLRMMNDMATHNANVQSWSSFLGCGSYHHFIPSFIWQLVSRGEFLTPYTPYQPEVSQGTLQVIFEYQSMMCELFDLEVANASNYDLSTAVVEAVLMAMRVTKRQSYAVVSHLHPEYRAVTHTTLRQSGCYTEQLVSTTDAGAVDVESLQAALNEQCAAVVVQYPSYLGTTQDLREIADTVHAAGALLIVAVPDPIAMGLLESPGAMGADIVVAEGQALGNPVNYGGPYVGIFATRQKYVRQMPGRIAGATVDGKDRRGFVLTLSTREQHIRRAKATSNICTNQQLCALAVTMYTAWLGKEGLQVLARQNWEKAMYAREQLTSIAGVTAPFTTPHFHEFTIRLPRAACDVLSELREYEIFGGVARNRWEAEFPNDLIVCVTEQNTKAEIDAFVVALTEVLS